MAKAAGRTAVWKRTRPAGSGALRDTSRAISNRPRIHSSPNSRVAGTSARKPIVGSESRSSPMTATVGSPVEMPKSCRARSAAASSASSHSTTNGTARPASSRGLATARWCSGRRKQ